MPRNNSGVYSLPSGNPVIVGTTIEADWANTTMEDVANELTASLPRDGSAPMTGPLVLARDGVLDTEPVSVKQLNTVVNGSNNYLPAGAVQLFAANAFPQGWLKCNGQAVSRTTYSELFSTIGTTYGAGNGSTTFNVPDLRGMFVRGLDESRGYDSGRTIGSSQSPANQSHTHTTTVNNPLHNHTITDTPHSHGITDSTHAHGYYGYPAVFGTYGYETTPSQSTDGLGFTDAAYSQISVNAGSTGVALADSAQATSVTVNANGTQTRPYNVAMIYCIKAYGSLQSDALGTTLLPNDNILINGDFQVWQRATNSTASGYTTDDRWCNKHNGSSKNHYQSAFTRGQTDVPGSPLYYSTTNVTSVTGAGNYVSKSYRVDDVLSLGGSTVTFSFYAKADDVKNISVEACQVFGVTGTYSTRVDAIDVVKQAITTDWARYSFTFDIPSIAGKDITTDEHYTEFVIWFDAGTNFDSRTDSLGHQSGIFNVGRVKLEYGTTATAFVPEYYEETLDKCQFYYEPGNGYLLAWDAFTNYPQRTFISFNKRKRIVPSCTVLRISGDTATPTILATYKNGTSIDIPFTTKGHAMVFLYKAEAEYVA